MRIVRVIAAFGFGLIVGLAAGAIVSVGAASDTHEPDTETGTESMPTTETPAEA